MVAQIEQQQLDRLDKDTKWLRTRYNELLDEFKDRYVAIMNEKIIEDATHLAK